MVLGVAWLLSLSALRCAPFPLALKLPWPRAGTAHGWQGALEPSIAQTPCGSVSAVSDGKVKTVELLFIRLLESVNTDIRMFNLVKRVFVGGVTGASC